MKNKLKRIKYRRKREGKTDYSKRLRMLVSPLPRLVIRKSLKNIIAQIVAYDPKGDKVLASADSVQLKKLGWKLSRNNTPASYLVGLMIGKRAVKAGIKQAITDIGLETSVKGSKIYAVVKGASDAGLKVPHSAEIIPTEDRIMGKHIKKSSAEIEKLMTDLKGKIQ